MREVPRQVKVLAFGVFLVMTGLTLVVPILPLYAREFGVSRTAAGALISSFAVARLVFDVAGGVATDRFGARRLMLGGALLLAVASVAAALAPTFAILMVARVLEGVGSAAFATAAMQLVVVSTPRERRGRAMAVFQTGLLAGISIGPVVGGLAAEVGDFTTPFWIYAVLGLGVAGLVAVAIEEQPTRSLPPAAIYRAAGQLLRRPAFLALLFVTFAIFVMRAGARITLLPLYGGEELGLGEAQIGIVIAVAAGVNLLLVNPGGWLVDRVGRVPVLVAGLVGAAVAIAAHGWATTFTALVVLSLGFGLVAALVGIPPPTLAGDLAPEGAEGASVGLYRMAADVGIVAGPLVMGAVAEAGGFREGFVISGALLLVAAVVALAIRPGTRTPAGAPVIAEGAV